MNRNYQNIEQLSYINTEYSPQRIYKKYVIKKGMGWTFKRKLFLRLYLLALNISMIRLLFFSQTMATLLKSVPLTAEVIRVLTGEPNKVYLKVGLGFLPPYHGAIKYPLINLEIK